MEVSESVSKKVSESIRESVNKKVSESVNKVSESVKLLYKTAAREKLLRGSSEVNN